MGLQYVVAKRVFGFDKTKTEKYVAKSVGAGELDFDKLCTKVSRILGIHRKIVDLVAVGLVDIMSEEIDVGKSANTQEGVTASNIVRKRILFCPGKNFSQMLGNMSITRMVMPDTDYTDGGDTDNNGGSKPSGGDGGIVDDPLG